MRKRSLDYVRRRQAKWLEKFQKMGFPCRGCGPLVSHTTAKAAAEGTPYEHVCPECSEQTGYVTEIEFQQTFFLPHSYWELKEEVTSLQKPDSN